MTMFNGGLVFDLETTGKDPQSDRIITAYLGEMDAHGRILQERSFVVDPMVPIPEESVRVHGYDRERVDREANATIYELVSWLHAVITSEARHRSLPVIGYNLQYDLTMLEAERARWTPNIAPLQFFDRISAQTGVPVIDTFVLDKAADPYRKGSRKLVDTARHYKVHLSEADAHGASADAVAAGRIAIKLTEHWPQLFNHGIYTLHERQIEWKKKQSASLQAYFRKTDPNATVAGEWPTIPNPERTAA